MTAATHDDVLRLFPGLQDHATLEILETGATIGELETMSALLTGDDGGLIDARSREGGRAYRLLNILTHSGIQPQQDRDH